MSETKVYASGDPLAQSVRERTSFARVADGQPMPATQTDGERVSRSLASFVGERLSVGRFNRGRRQRGCADRCNGSPECRRAACRGRWSALRGFPALREGDVALNVDRSAASHVVGDIAPSTPLTDLWRTL